MEHNMGCGVFSLLLRGKSGACWYAPAGSPSDPVARNSRWWNMESWTSLPLFSYFSALVLVYGCCLWSTAYWIFGTRALHGSTVDTCSTGGFWTNFSHFFHVVANSNPEAFGLRSHRMEKHAQSMLLVVVALSAVRTFTLDINCFKSSVHGSLRQFSLRRAAFFGALDDEKIFIIEGSCQLTSIGCCH